MGLRLVYALFRSKATGQIDKKPELCSKSWDRLLSRDSSLFITFTELIPHLPRHSPPHPTPRRLDIPCPPRDQVNMGMHHRLPGHLATVHADVETGHAGIFGDDLFPQKRQQRASASRFSLKDIPK
jgi:hypothetical protein